MQVQINGKDHDVPDGSTVTAMLQQLDAAPQRVAVEVNRELVTRGKFDQTVLRQGDTIEIVTFVGGG